MISANPQLRVLLFGGFEVWSGDRPLRGFESQKVRALFAYLALQRDRALARDHLAALLWGDKDDESARRNLRQALYNLKATLPVAPDGGGRPHLVVEAQEVRFDGDSSYWLDVEAFEEGVGLAGDGGTGFHQLAGAVQLYRGDLLAGFQVKDCAEFEEWLVAAQERLRESALEALRRLVAGYLARGEYRLGIEHARRLVAMDPLSEVAHRQLLRLYDVAGQRGRALAHYTDLRELLRRELGVEPLPETREMYEGILADALRAQAGDEKPEPLGPIVPLVGREAPYARLTARWQAVLEGAPQLTLVAGEEGIGKTRLLRSFIDATTARRRTRVLTAACDDLFPRPSCRALAEALRQALPETLDGAASSLAALPRELRTDLAALLPELAADRSPAAGIGERPAPPAPSREALVESVALLLRELAREHPPAGAEPVILFLDDLQWADFGTLAILEALPSWLAGAPVWILGAFDPSGLDADHPLLRLAAAGGPGDDGEGGRARIDLERLAPAAIERIAGALVGAAETAELARLLGAASGGLPLALVTLVNAMWDEGELVSELDGRWSFRGAAAHWTEPAGEGLDRLLLRRVRRLPTSTRRLASMAAVIGLRFDVELLQLAEDEHAAVVEVGLEILLERWLMRQHRERWSSTGLESSLALWSRGARRGRFQFDHARVRAALYRDLNPLRRQVLHKQTAAALERLHAADREPVVEELAHHWLEAGEWERALPWLRRAAARALAVAAPEDARRAWERERLVLDKLAQQAGDDFERRNWRGAAEELDRRLAEPDSC